MGDISTAQRDAAVSKHEAMPGGRFPIRNRQDLANAIRAVGRAKAEDRPAVRRFIMRRAKALGAQVPTSWAADGSLR